MITEDQVEKAITIIDELFWKQMAGSHAAMRAALESVESELLAQGMEKAADLIEKAGGRPGYVAPDYQPDTIKLAAELIRASAKQTREGKGP